WWPTRPRWPGPRCAKRCGWGLAGPPWRRHRATGPSRCRRPKCAPMPRACRPARGWRSGWARAAPRWRWRSRWTCATACAAAGRRPAAGARAGAAGPESYTCRSIAPRTRSPMFESLTQRLSGTIERLRGRGRLTEENIRAATREVRIALLEADVALPVVEALIERIKVRAVGQEVLKSLTPGQALIKVVRDELTAVMGAQSSDLNLNVPAPAVVLMAGLQ